MANPYYTGFTSHYLRFVFKCPTATLFESEVDKKFFGITKKFLNSIDKNDWEVVQEVFMANSKEVPYNKAVELVSGKLALNVNNVYRITQLVQKNLAKEMGLI